MQDINIFDIYTGDKYPKTLIKKIDNNTYHFIPYDINNVDGVYSWKYIEIPPEKFSYTGFIDSLVTLKYSLKDILAIMLNNLSDPENEKYKKELKELQDWRMYVKNYAKEYFNIKN